MVRWFCDNAMEANPRKFQGILFKGNKQVSDFMVSVDGHDIEFFNLTFDSHISDICIKASRQISALQRLTGVLDYPSRKAIYGSFIFAHFNYCPLVWFFTRRASIIKMQKNQERALRFVLKDSVSDYESLLSKSGINSFRISSIKIWRLKFIRFYMIWGQINYHHSSWNLMFLISWEMMIN